jgi:hypothetical protein
MNDLLIPHFGVCKTLDIAENYNYLIIWHTQDGKGWIELFSPHIDSPYGPTVHSNMVKEKTLLDAQQRWLSKKGGAA